MGRRPWGGLRRVAAGLGAGACSSGGRLGGRRRPGPGSESDWFTATTPSAPATTTARPVPTVPRSSSWPGGPGCSAPAGAGGGHRGQGLGGRRGAQRREHGPQVGAPARDRGRERRAERAVRQMRLHAPAAAHAAVGLRQLHLYLPAVHVTPPALGQQRGPGFVDGLLGRGGGDAQGGADLVGVAVPRARAAPAPSAAARAASSGRPPAAPAARGRPGRRRRAANAGSLPYGCVAGRARVSEIASLWAMPNSQAFSPPLTRWLPIGPVGLLHRGLERVPRLLGVVQDREAVAVQRAVVAGVDLAERVRLAMRSRAGEPVVAEPSRGSWSFRASDPSAAPRAVSSPMADAQRAGGGA